MAPKKTAAQPERSAAERLPLVYLDDSEVHAHPYLAKVWRRKGQVLKVPAAGDDHKFTVFGALDYASGQVVWQLHARTDETAFMAFLDHLAAALPATEPVVLVLVLVLDNASYHKSQALRAYWQRLADRFQPFFLPAYAPQLNLIERLWRDLKQKLACHRWWNDLDRLIHATDMLLADLEVHFPADDGRPTFRPAHNFCDSAMRARLLSMRRIMVR